MLNNNHWLDIYICNIVHDNFEYISSIAAEKYVLAWGRFSLKVGVSKSFSTENISAQSLIDLGYKQTSH